ncbi:MAG: RNA polymerase subunit sigma [Verrucomicrobiae bacterium]|nr:RNA polymerase subunit sigma [Verrucomicrobiae bacterium]
MAGDSPPSIPTPAVRGAEAADLLPLVYPELRRLAAARMAQEAPGHTLQPTALVHEAWIRLAGENHPWASRRQFFAAAAEAMRRILIERARRAGRVRHGRGLRRTSLEDLDLATEADGDTVELVGEALDRLAGHDPAGAELIRLRFFTGLSNAEAAALMGLSERTAKRVWTYARGWLHEELRRLA